MRPGETARREAAAALVEALDVLSAALPRAVELARTEERAAVVAWLNNAADTVYYDCCCGPVAACADAIERGEHRRGGDATTG
jgi:hypothetical protein